MFRVFLRICLPICVLGVACNAFAQAPGLRATAAAQVAIDTQPESFHTAGTAAPNSSVMVPRLIKFSGMLKDGKGEAKTGVAGVTFAIYAEQEGGAPLWMETQNVQLDEGGRYTALLGASNKEGVPLELFSTGQTRWLGIESADTQESPRIVLVSVPYALKAADAETLGGMPASAFALANPPAMAVPSQSTIATKKSGSQVKAAASSTPKTAASTVTDDDFVVKFDPTNNLIPSAIYESNGNVGIGTTSPTAPLQVNGNILLTGQTVHEVQVSGATTNGRFGQDANGTFMASDTSGSPLRFLTSNGNLNEWMRIGSTGSVNIGSAQASKYGEVVFARNDLDIVHSISSPTDPQIHFRFSRSTPDAGGGQHLLITPYQFGMVVEYPATLEFWVQDFSVHHNQLITRAATAPNFWVGDEIDSGGLFATARDNGGGTSSNVILAADRFNHMSHGSMNFIVRNTTDAFKFDVGPYGSEVMKAQISGTGSASNIDLFNGPVQATLRAENGTSVDAEIGSTSNHPLSLVANNGAARATLFPSGHFSIGNNSDTAPLAVGTAAQFQVSSAGAATIGGGTAITRHISVSTALAFSQFAPVSCNVLSVTATGAADGDSVALGIPNALASINGLTWFGWVSAPDAVSIRGCNVSNERVPAPPTVTVRVDVWQH